MDISPETHLLVVGTDEKPVVEDNRILLQTIKDESYVYVPLTPQIEELFGVTTTDVEAVETYDSKVNSDSESIENPNIASCSDNQPEVLEGKFFWDHKSTLLMLEEYRKRVSKFRNPKFKKKLLWDEIANIMQQNGYSLGSDAVDKKLRNMKNTFRTILDNKKKTGRGRMNWPYFNVFEDIFKDDRTINIAYVMSTTNISTGNTVIPETSTISQLLEKPLSPSVDINENMSSPSSCAPLNDATPKKKCKT